VPTSREGEGRRGREGGGEGRGEERWRTGRVGKAGVDRRGVVEGRTSVETGERREYASLALGGTDAPGQTHDPKIL